MAAIVIPRKDQDAGIPQQWSDTIDGSADALITGSEPELMVEDIAVAANQTMLALTVVGFNGATPPALVPAVLTTTPPIGVLVVDVTSGASGTLKGVPVYRAGCFNPDRLIWPATINTDALKFAAFRGAPTPTNIIIRRPKQATPV